MCCCLCALFKPNWFMDNYVLLEVSTAAADTANMNTERGIKAVSAASESSLFASFILDQTNGPDSKELLDHAGHNMHMQC